MRSLGNWRSPAIAAEFAGHDNADFAQEFLRRNPEYRREYDETLLGIAGDKQDRIDRMEGLARRWGMTFPRLAGCRPAQCTCALGTVARLDSRHRRCCTVRV